MEGTPAGLGHNLPPQEGFDHPHGKIVRGRTPVRNMLREIPAHYLSAMEENEKLRPCCRKPKDHDVEYLKTHEDAPGPDLMIFHCNCGRRHFRLACGSGRISS